MSYFFLYHLIGVIILIIISFGIIGIIKFLNLLFPDISRRDK